MVRIYFHVHIKTNLKNENIHLIDNLLDTVILGVKINNYRL